MRAASSRRRGHSFSVSDHRFLAILVGGLGLASAVRVRAAAHWASWADCLRMVRKRHPSVADTMVLGLERDPAPKFASSQGVSADSDRRRVRGTPRGTFCLRIPFKKQRMMENLPNRRGDGSKKQLVLSMRDSLPTSPWSWDKSTKP